MSLSTGQKKIAENCRVNFYINKYYVRFRALTERWARKWEKREKMLHWEHATVAVSNNNNGRFYTLTRAVERVNITYSIAAARLIPVHG